MDSAIARISYHPEMSYCPVSWAGQGQGEGSRGPVFHLLGPGGLGWAVTLPPHSLTPTGIPSVTKGWGLWALSGAVTLLLLISLAVHLFQWTSGRSRGPPGHGR